MMYGLMPFSAFMVVMLKVAEMLLINPDKIRISREPYDWLGHGMYFWESNYERALFWAEEKAKRGKIKNPAVIGAVIQLGHCLNLLDLKYIKMMGSYYSLMEDMYIMHGALLPENKDLPSDEFKDKILRELDCSVIQFMHDEIFKAIKAEEKEKWDFPNYNYSIPPGELLLKGHQHLKDRQFLKKHISRFV